MRVIPPTITAATTLALTSPVTQVGTPNALFMVSERVFAWMALPVRNAVTASRAANSTASGFHFAPSPRSM
jgi:hypothetical protein